MRKRLVAGVASSVLVASFLTVVGYAPSQAAPAGWCKQITVLTNRTDIAPTTFTKVYGPQFTAGPGKGTTVKFESFTNYNQDVRTMMNTKNYGDVLGIPVGVTPNQFPQFLAHLERRQISLRLIASSMRELTTELFTAWHKQVTLVVTL